MTNDRHQRDPRDQSPASLVSPPAGTRPNLPGGGGMAVTDMTSDMDDAAELPSAFARVPIATTTEVSTDDEWIVEDLELDADESLAEGASQGDPDPAPPSRLATSELQPEDRGVAITLPPGLGNMIRGVARMSPAVRRPAAETAASEVAPESRQPALPAAVARPVNVPAVDPWHASGPWNATESVADDAWSLEQSELPLSPDTLRPVVDEEPAAKTMFALPGGAHGVLGDPQASDLFGEPEHEPAYGIEPIDPPIPFRQPAPVREVSKASTGRFERISRTPTPVVLQPEKVFVNAVDVPAAEPVVEPVAEPVAEPMVFREGRSATRDVDRAASQRITAEHEVSFVELAAIYAAGNEAVPGVTAEFPSASAVGESLGHTQATPVVPAVTEPVGHTQVTQVLPAVTGPVEVSDFELRLSSLRSAQRWSELASVLAQQAAQVSGAAQVTVLRELAALEVRGLRSAAAGCATLRRILSLSPNDLPALVLLVEQLAVSNLASELAALSLDGGRSAEWIDLRRRAAHELWRLQEYDAAARWWLFDGPDAVLPDEIAERLDEWRMRGARHHERIQVWTDRAESTPHSESAAKWLERAAHIAATDLNDSDAAVRLIEQANARAGDSLGRLSRLRELYRATRQTAALQRCLRRINALPLPPAQRIEVLRQQAEVHLSKGGEVAEAQRALLELLQVDASEHQAGDLLVNAFLATGQTDEAVTLLRQRLLRSPERHASAVLLERIAHLFSGSGDAYAAQAARAWQDTLHYAPHNVTTLTALATRAATCGLASLHATMLERIAQSAAPERQLDHVATIAAVREAAGAIADAVVACERILNVRPDDPAALERVVRLYTAAGETDRALLAIERAASVQRDASSRRAWLQKALDRVPADQPHRRWRYLRRVLLLHDSPLTMLPALVAAGVEAGAVDELTVVVRELIARTPAGAARLQAAHVLADLYRTQLGDPVRAFRTLAGQLHDSPPSADRLDSLDALAIEPSQLDEYLHALELRCVYGVPVTEVRERILVRAQLLAGRAKQPRLAFFELRRLLDIDPTDTDALTRLEALAKDHALATELDHALQELADRSAPQGYRTIAQRLAGNDSPVSDSAGNNSAVSAKELHYRRLAHLYANGWTDNDAAALTRDAHQLDAWLWVSCVLEARAWQDEANPTQALVTVAELLATHAGRPDRAFELMCHVVLTAPQDATHDATLATLAERTGRHSERLDALRTAAFLPEVSPEREQQLIAAALESAHALNDPEELSIHRQMLEVQPQDTVSLRALLAAARHEGRAWDARALLLQLQSQVTDTTDRIALLAEAATVSRDALHDKPTAMALFSEALTLDDSRDELRTAWRQLAEVEATVDTRIALLRADLRAAVGGEAEALRSQLRELLVANGRQAESLELLQQAAAERLPGAEAAWRKALRAEGRHDELLRSLVASAEAEPDATKASDLWREAWHVIARFGVHAEPPLRERILRGALVAGDDRMALQLALGQLLRSQGRYKELRQVLVERLNAAPVSGRTSLLRQIARIDHHGLNDTQSATDIWLQLVTADESDGSGLLALATLATDIRQRWDWRARHAQMLPPREAALSLCALAELADDHHIHRDRIADLYREARRLDPGCEPAAEAVKGIGRRLGRLRPAAALLQDDQEATWSAAARAVRLIELASQSPIGSDSARDLFGRALALDPDQVKAWRGASAATQAAGDTPEASRLLLQAVHAWHRTHAPDGQAAGVDLMVEAAELARVAGDSDACQWLCTEIIEYDPTRVTAALVVARKWADEGAPATALALLEPLLVLAVQPDPELLSLAADLAAATGDAASALNWRTRALGERPLLSAALQSLAMEQAHAGRPASAVSLAAASLVQQTDLSRRAETLCRMGTWLDDDTVACHDEALACFEEAFALGYRRRDVLQRLHERYRTHSAGARGEEVVQALLETETDEVRRAVLTLALARARAGRPGDEVRARSTIEAALEVQPASLELRRLLVAVLERQNDRPALRSALEQLAHQANAHEAARIWLQLADLARQGGEPAAFVMELLARSARACATTEALEQLEAHYAEHEPASSARLHNLARLAEVSERPYRHVIEVGRQLLDQHPRQAWCMLAPLLMVRQGEEALRGRLRELRRDHERPPLLVADAAARRNLFPQGTPGHAVALLDALRLIESEVFLGARSTAELGAQEVFEVSLHSAIGRTFVALSEAMGISGASLHRANSLAEPCMVWFRGQNVAIVLRSDILQSMARAEIGFVLVSALELAQPGGRVLASMVGERLHGVVAAIRRGLELPADSPSDPEVCSIVEALSADTREAATALLTPFVSIDDETMLRDTRRALQGRAHAAGLVAGADLSQIFRILGRMNGDGDWGGAFANASAIDDLLLHAEASRHLTAFAASPIFGELLLRSAEMSA